jgi:hypothetical protein
MDFFSGEGTEDEGDLAPCKYRGAGGPRSESLPSEVRLTANQLALSRSASVDPWKVVLTGDGTRPRRSSASRSCSLNLCEQGGVHVLGEQPLDVP